MIHITKVKTGFMVVVIAKNGEALTTSEILERKTSAWNNVRALLTLLECSAWVQDDTDENVSKVFRYQKLGKYFLRQLGHNDAAVPRYIPGNNTKSKRRAVK